MSFHAQISPGFGLHDLIFLERPQNFEFRLFESGAAVTHSAGFISMTFLFCFVSKDLPRQGQRNFIYYNLSDHYFVFSLQERADVVRSAAPFPITVRFTEEFAVRFTADLCGDPSDHVYIIVRYFL